MIRIPQLDKNAINPQCPILIPPRVAKIPKQVKVRLRRIEDILEEDSQAKEKRSWNQSSSIQITLSIYEEGSSKDGPTKLRKEWIVKSGIRLSIQEVLYVVVEH